MSPSILGSPVQVLAGQGGVTVRLAEGPSVQEIGGVQEIKLNCSCAQLIYRWDVLFVCYFTICWFNHLYTYV